MSSNYSNQQPPRVPRRSNRKVYTTVSLIAVCGVLLSGGAGYLGAKAAMNSQGSSSNAETDENNNLSIINQSDRDNDQEILVLDVSDVVERIRPSIVEITTEYASNGNSIFGQYVAQGAGSGVIFSEDGYIVTNDHVIANASSIQVKTLDGDVYNATLVGTDPQTDIAVIKIDAQGLSPVTVGNSNDIRVGEPAIAIGNPLGSLGGTTTTGIISAVGREITIENETMTLLQTDAAINAGNSGGGLFDINGELIGIVNAKTSAEGVEGLGFAIPISDVTQVIDDLVANGVVTSRPVLNVSLQDVTDTNYYDYHSDREPGTYIVQIIEGGSADQAGLQVGDRIVSFDGVEISDAAGLKQQLKKHAIGDVVDIVIERDGEQQTISMELFGPNN